MGKGMRSLGREMWAHFQYSDVMWPHYPAIHTAHPLSRQSWRAGDPSRATWAQERPWERKGISQGGRILFVSFKGAKRLIKNRSGRHADQEKETSLQHQAESELSMSGECEGMDGWLGEGARQVVPAPERGIGSSSRERVMHLMGFSTQRSVGLAGGTCRRSSPGQ